MSGFSITRLAIVPKLVPRPSQGIENRKLKNGAALMAVFLVVSCGTLTGAAAAGRPAAYASARHDSVAAILVRAQRGNVAAEARLGWLYSIGRGVPQNYYEAARWYYRAATRGNADAQFALGMLYNKGQGVQRDYVLSYLWLNLSAAQSAGADRDFKTTIRDAIASKMTPQQLLTAQELGLKWSRSH